MPTATTAAMPSFVVDFQKSSITKAGKFAEAATLKAHHTKRFAFILAKRRLRPTAASPTADS